MAKSVDDLHSNANNLTKQTALTEKGEAVNGRGDTPNKHDILTGSDPEGRFSTAGLPSGIYSIKVTLAGFLPVVEPDIQVNDQHTTTHLYFAYSTRVRSSF